MLIGKNMLKEYPYVHITGIKFKEAPNIFIKKVIKRGNPNPTPYMTTPAIGTNS